MDASVRRPVLFLVDDDSEVLQALHDLVSHTLPIVEVLTYECPERALEALRGRRADAIVADYRMSPLNGLEFLRQAHRVAPDAKRVLATAYPSELGSSNVDLVLVKPLDTMPFVERLRALLGLAG